jgi:peptide/nickel transport system permease protein
MTTLSTPEVVPAAGPVRLRRPRLDAATVIPGLMLAATVALLAVVPFLPTFDVDAQDLSRAFLPPFEDTAHLLGTDALGRDVLSRLSVAGQVSLLIAVAAVAINLVLGAILGLAAGFFGKWVDTVISAVGDLQLAVPIMLLLIVVVSIVGPGATTLIVILGVTYWVAYGRSARAIAMTLRDREFILSPITQGAQPLWILTRHLLPRVLPQLAILATFDIGVMITISSSLDYLGLGVPAPTPTWGGMIAEGQDYLQTDPWLVLLPSIAIFFVVGSIQFLSQRYTGEQSLGAIGGRQA